MTRYTKLISSIALMFILVLTGACGDGQDGKGVLAVNLESGQTQTFSSEGDVPVGWAVCPEDGCKKTPERTPCQNLGPGTCEQNPTCRLRQLGCSVSGCANVDNDDTSTDGCLPGPVQCDYECVNKDTLSCDEITDEKQCAGNKACSWDPIVCALGCQSDGYCPPCPGTGVCRTKTPKTCEDLGKKRCSSRPDCEWSPGICPMMDCAPGQSDCVQPPCASFCQTKEPTNCPVLSAPEPGFCEGGTMTPRYDAQGCLTGYDCTTDCPAIAMVAPHCDPNEKVVPRYNEKGCLTGYECQPQCPAIPLLFPDCPQDTTARPKYDKAGCLTGYSCESCPAITMIAPDCKDQEFITPDYSPDGCLVGYRCESCPALPVAPPICDEGSKLEATTDSNGCFGEYICKKAD